MSRASPLTVVMAVGSGTVARPAVPNPASTTPPVESRTRLMPLPLVGGPATKIASPTEMTDV